MINSVWYRSGTWSGIQITPDFISTFAIPLTVVRFELQHNSLIVKRTYRVGIERAKRGHRGVYLSEPSLCPLFAPFMPPLCQEQMPNAFSTSCFVNWMRFYADSLLSWKFRYHFHLKKMSVGIYRIRRIECNLLFGVRLKTVLRNWKQILIQLFLK